MHSSPLEKFILPIWGFFFLVAISQTVLPLFAQNHLAVTKQSLEPQGNNYKITTVANSILESISLRNEIQVSELSKAINFLCASPQELGLKGGNCFESMLLLRSIKISENYENDIYSFPIIPDLLYNLTNEKMITFLSIYQPQQ